MDVPFRSGGYEAHGEAWVTFPGTASWGYQEERSHSSGAADTVGIDTGQSQGGSESPAQWGPPLGGAETASRNLGTPGQAGA